MNQITLSLLSCLQCYSKYNAEDTVFLTISFYKPFFYDFRGLICHCCRFNAFSLELKSPFLDFLLFTRNIRFY